MKSVGRRRILLKGMETRSRRGRKMQANLAHDHSKGERDGGKIRWTQEKHHRSYMEVLLGPDIEKGSTLRKENVEEAQKPRSTGWIVDGKERGVRVASWVVKEQKKSLNCSPVGFLKTSTNGQR